jgi:DNA invertase Pin-like site-specific DNA recombinase
MKKSAPTHRDKIMAGLEKAAAKGRKPGRPLKVTDAQMRAVIPLGTVKGAAKVKMSVSSFIRRRRLIEEGESNG